MSALAAVFALADITASALVTRQHEHPLARFFGIVTVEQGDMADGAGRQPEDGCCIGREGPSDSSCRRCGRGACRNCGGNFSAGDYKCCTGFSAL